MKIMIPLIAALTFLYSADRAFSRAVDCKSESKACTEACMDYGAAYVSGDAFGFACGAQTRP